MAEPTEFGLKSRKKYGLESNYRGIKSGDIVRYKPIYASFYWQKTPDNPKPTNNTITVGKEYVVEYAYSSRLQIKNDNGRITSYSDGYFETKLDGKWISLFK
jgi:hypothetical protein